MCGMLVRKQSEIVEGESCPAVGAEKYATLSAAV